jgi:hypothetical protein
MSDIRKRVTWLETVSGKPGQGLSSLLHHVRQHGRLEPPPYTVADVPWLRAQGGFSALLADHLEEAARCDEISTPE